jgi:hypothetical protein
MFSCFLFYRIRRSHVLKTEQLSSPVKMRDELMPLRDLIAGRNGSDVENCAETAAVKVLLLIPREPVESLRDR